MTGDYKYLHGLLEKGDLPAFLVERYPEAGKILIDKPKRVHPRVIGIIVSIGRYFELCGFIAIFIGSWLIVMKGEFSPGVYTILAGLILFIIDQLVCDEITELSALRSELDGFTEVTGLTPRTIAALNEGDRKGLAKRCMVEVCMEQVRIQNASPPGSRFSEIPEWIEADKYVTRRFEFFVSLGLIDSKKGKRPFYDAAKAQLALEKKA